jgi:hypothetical protein
MVHAPWHTQPWMSLAALEVPASTFSIGLGLYFFLILFLLGPRALPFNALSLQEFLCWMTANHKLHPLPPQMI